MPLHSLRQRIAPDYYRHAPVLRLPRQDTLHSPSSEIEYLVCRGNTQSENLFFLIFTYYVRITAPIKITSRKTEHRPISLQ